MKISLFVLLLICVCTVLYENYTIIINATILVSETLVYEYCENRILFVQHTSKYKNFENLMFTELLLKKLLYKIIDDYASWLQ